ncbi:helix-turn-helix domain-containing protein [Leucobacter allii]|nr:helix-turn-helix transcriptional regulator [Leucobacter allii]UOR03332.1 helix-turn-helix domain-containing protein [Leucobacter allii]
MLGESLRERRTVNGETLNEVAARAGVSPQYLSEIERGLKEPSSEIVAAVGSALGITLLDLTMDVARSLSMMSDARTEVSGSQAFFALAA